MAQGDHGDQQERRRILVSPVRPFRPDDVPQVAALRTETFSSSSRSSREDLERYLELIFFQNPWRDEELPSLVYEDGTGRVVGFIGLVPRAFEMAGRPVRAAVATQFMVAPSARGLTSIKLVRRAFAGPQELLFSDVSNTAARRIWLGLGASSAPAYAFQWVATVKPFDEAAARLGMSASVRATRLLARPFLAVGDALATRLPGSRLRFPPSTGVEGPFESTLVCDRLPEVTDGRELRPVYEPAALDWLLERVKDKWGVGRTRGFVLRGDDGSEAGWALYVSKPGGVNQVLHLAARPAARGLVIEHLRRRASLEGARAVQGPIFPDYFPELPAPGIGIDSDGKDVLFHTGDDGLRASILGGRAYLGGLEGEWWMDF